MSTARCDQCGKETYPGDRFCGHCGGLLPAGERQEGDEARTTLTAAEVNRRLGRVYLARGKRRDAVRVWRKALLLKPEDRELAWLLSELERDLAAEAEEQER